MPDVEVIGSRSVPLGGPRAMTVRRTLPQRARSLIGAWCFADHYGPDDVTGTDGMDVPPHPHTGLQTISWLFAGAIEHRDSHGVRAVVRPGQLGLMTAGAGIAHSEVSCRDTTTLHGVQLWVALPDRARNRPRDFLHHTPEPVEVGSAVVRVLVGSLGGVTSPAPTHSPLLGAEVVLSPHGKLELPVEPDFEYGVLVDTGPVRLDDVTEVSPAELGYRAPTARSLRLANPAGRPARLMLLGGEPFTEPLVMWWNFVGRSHEEIVEFRTQWQAESDRFGRVEGYDGHGTRLSAPRLPTTRLKPRLTPPGPRDPSAWG